MQDNFKESFPIGSFSFLPPFIGVFLCTLYVSHWSLQASLIAGCALSTNSLAVVYSVLVETGLSRTEIGKKIISALGLFAILFAVKIVMKFAGVWFFAKKYIPHGSMYTTLLMSTGLTFGSISSLYSYQVELIN